MARPRYWLIKNDCKKADDNTNSKDSNISKFRVLSFNKNEQTVKLRGQYCDFETSLEKALNSGYILTKETV